METIRGAGDGGTESCSAGAGTLQGLQALVIEDSLEVRDVLTTVLRLEGAEAVGVANGRDALSVCRTHDFDVVISDLGLPDIPGDVLIRSLVDLALHPLHVIVITGESGAALSRAIEAGAGVVFTKPCDWADILAYLKQLGLAVVA